MGISRRLVASCCAMLAGLACGSALASDPPHPLMEWVKRHPLPGAAKPSPRLGYETTYGCDPVSRLLIRHGGHNQGGGGEQNAETWTYDLDRDVWTLKEPNDAPPGICCGQQNVFDAAGGLFVRFPAFSGNHGWQSFREIRLKDSAAWTYDLAANTWRNMRPWPAPRIAGLRGAAYDPHHQVTVVHGGETTSFGTALYDLYANTWHVMKPKGPAPEANLSQPGFTYDAVHRVFVLFGSQFDTDDRTWLYDLRTNAWRVLEIPGERPPAREKESSPILAADTRSGIVLCSIRNRREGDRLETWALDVTKAAWTRLKVAREPDRSGGRSRVLLYLEDRNLFFLENSTSGNDGQSREQQVWTFRYAEAPAPPPPVRLRVTTEKDAAVLEWDAPGDRAGAAWQVYRAEDAQPWQVGWAKLPATRSSPYKDAGLKPGTAYFYQVRCTDGGGQAGPASFVARTQPPVVMGLVVSVAGPKRAELAWEKSPAQDVAGYHVERAEVAVYSSEEVRRIADRYRPASDLAAGTIRAIGAFGRLTASPAAEPRFVDETLDLSGGRKGPAGPVAEVRALRPDEVAASGKPYRCAVYAYRIIAVNRLGVESGPSPLVFTWPSAVQCVFSKEEGADKTRLRWRANPEKGLKGYLVYRHGGPYDKEPIVRLTAEPVAATEFFDDGAGKSTRRYEVVAVDALGQEGEPSQPVWARREWARFYGPYAGEWHQ